LGLQALPLTLLLSHPGLGPAIAELPALMIFVNQIYNSNHGQNTMVKKTNRTAKL